MIDIYIWMFSLAKESMCWDISNTLHFETMSQQKIYKPAATTTSAI
jgi:hypothetical protein